VKTTSALIKLIIFTVVTVLVTGLLATTIGNFRFGGTTEYRAIFTDVTGLLKGDDIRIAGVRVGSVEKVEVHDRTLAQVTISVDKERRLSESTKAAVRYRNLVGQRYIALIEGAGSDTPLKSGATIPLAQTTPALDLTVLFNGFKPLFAALSPADVNKLSYEIVTVFQGEGGTLESLLSHTASVTSTLASKDQVIGSLITNLNEVMVTIGNRDAQLSDLLIKLRQFVSGLSSDRQAILGSLDSISALAVQTSDLVTGIRPSLTTDVKQLNKVAGTLDRNKAELDRALQVLPIKLNKVGRTATYGSFFNFYLCNFKGAVKLPAGSPIKEIPLDYSTNSARCDL
jgi:phospholipid/cholesterol/gamma-HCH transport system substrate-binding protein